MSKGIYIFFILPIVFCSLKMIPVSETVEGNLFSEYYLYCSKSKNGSINIFYKLSGNSYHLIYDQNEDLFNKFKNTKKNVKKLEFFDSDKEYLMVSNNLYYVNEAEQLSFNNEDDFFLLKNKDFIAIDYKLSSLRYYLELKYYPYPPDKYNIFSLKNVYINNYEFIETSEAILLFLLLDKDALSNPLDLYILDKKNLELNKIKTLHDEVYGFVLINLNDNSDVFIYCISELFDSTTCYLTKYNNKQLIIENSIEAFSWECVLLRDFLQFRKNYAIMNDQKIALICPSSDSIFLTILEYKDNNLILGNIIDKKIINYPFYSMKISYNLY